MSFIQRFKFFLLGIIGGCFLVVLFFGDRNSCTSFSSYLPEGRVLDEVNYKPLKFSPEAEVFFSQYNVDTAKFKKEYLPELDINFDLSDQRAKPCGKYVSFYKDSLVDLEIHFEKCKNSTEIKKVVKK